MPCARAVAGVRSGTGGRGQLDGISVCGATFFRRRRFQYADVDGTIAMRCPGWCRCAVATAPAQRPRRETDWEGSIAPDMLPSIMNPSSHQIVAANNEAIAGSRS
jgi:hypothetical protein